MKDTFESFDQFCYRIYEEDEKGIIGSIINRTATFIPRSVRFRKAKKTMSLFLNGFDKKTDNLIKNFESNLDKMVTTTNNNYKAFKRKKIEPLMATDKIDQAVNLSAIYKKELESIKSNELKKVKDAIYKIMDHYTVAMDKRIETPGFVINVELSEKGKGKLKAKWSELSSIKLMEADEKLSRLMDNESLSIIDSIISELDAFIEEHKYSYGKNTIDFYISTIEKVGPDKFRIEVFLRSPGHRHSLSEKGILIADDENKLIDHRHSKLVKMKNLYFSSFSIVVTAKDTDYVRPYLKLTKSVKPIYGDIEHIFDMMTNATPPTQTNNVPDFNPNRI
jgi:hypothetical protein